MRYINLMGDIDDHVQPLFCGYSYAPIQNDNLIKTYLTFIEKVIADGDTKKYNYILDWIAYII